jgi:hypothetical protein
MKDRTRRIFVILALASAAIGLTTSVATFAIRGTTEASDLYPEIGETSITVPSRGAPSPSGRRMTRAIQVNPSLALQSCGRVGS